MKIGFGARCIYGGVAVSPGGRDQTSARMEESQMQISECQHRRKSKIKNMQFCGSTYSISISKHLWEIEM